jgi:hypothetical protein
MDESADPCAPQNEKPMRRITVTIPESVFAVLVLAKLFTRKTFNTLIAEAILLLDEKLKSAERDAA